MANLSLAFSVVNCQLTVARRWFRSSFQPAISCLSFSQSPRPRSVHCRPKTSISDLGYIQSIGIFRPVMKLQFSEYPTCFSGRKSLIPRHSLVNLRLSWSIRIFSAFGIVHASALGSNFYLTPAGLRAKEDQEITVAITFIGYSPLTWAFRLVWAGVDEYVPTIDATFYPNRRWDIDSPKLRHTAPEYPPSGR